LKETDEFLEEMQLDDVDIKIFQPYPGSPIWEHRENYDIEWDEIPPGQQYYKGHLGEYHGNVRTAALTNAEIVQAMNQMEGKYKRVG